MKLKLSISFVLLSFILLGCATWNVDLNHKQASTWMNSIFNAQDELYKAQVSAHNMDVLERPDGTITDGELEKRNGTRRFLRAKKAILDELQPLLDTYASYVSTGRIPPQQIETQAIRLINRLLEYVEDM